METIQRKHKNDSFVDEKRSPQFIPDLVLTDKLTFDFPFIDIQGFKQLEIPEHQVWHPFSSLFEESWVPTVPEVPKKKQTKLKLTFSQLVMISRGVCPFQEKFWVEIPHRKSWIYYHCKKECPGHDEVWIRRRDGLQKHHWVEQHERCRDGRWETVRGHYRKTS